MTSFHSASVVASTFRRPTRNGREDDKKVKSELDLEDPATKDLLADLSQRFPPC